MKKYIEDTDVALQLLNKNGGESPEDTFACGTTSEMPRMQFSTIRAPLPSPAPRQGRRVSWLRDMSAHLTPKCTRAAAHPGRTVNLKRQIAVAKNTKQETVATTHCNVATSLIFGLSLLSDVVEKGFSRTV